MKTVQRLTKNKQRKYQARKNKVNAAIKAQNFDARIVINKSLNYIYAQAIDPQGKILAATSDKKATGKTKSERAAAAGEAFAATLTKTKAKKFVIDRNGYPFHGRIQAFVDGMRTGGITV